MWPYMLYCIGTDSVGLCVIFVGTDSVVVYVVCSPQLVTLHSISRESNTQLFHIYHLMFNKWTSLVFNRNDKNHLPYGRLFFM